VDDYSKISIQEIRESIRFIHVYGQLNHIQILEWSDLFLKGSCDDVLRKKVMEYLINVPDIEKGGPLFYKVMMIIITSNTEEAICTLSLKVLFSRLHLFKEKTLVLQSVNYRELAED